MIIKFISTKVLTAVQLAKCVDDVFADPAHPTNRNSFLLSPFLQKRGELKGFVELSRVTVVEKVVDTAFDKPSLQVGTAAPNYFFNALTKDKKPFPHVVKDNNIWGAMIIYWISLASTLMEHAVSEV